MLVSNDIFFLILFERKGEFMSWYVLVFMSLRDIRILVLVFVSRIN